MRIYSSRPDESKNHVSTQGPQQQKHKTGIVSNAGPINNIQRQYHEYANNSAHVSQLRAYQEMANNRPGRGWVPVQAAKLPVRTLGSGPVTQLKWVKVRGTHNQYYWEGPIPFYGKPPLPPGGIEVPDPHAPIDDRAGMPKREGGGGFFLKGGDNRMVTIDGTSVNQKGNPFNIGQSNDTTSYFGGRVQVHHQGPEIEQQDTSSDFTPTHSQTFQQPLYNPYPFMGWSQDRDTQKPQDVDRKNEKTIMGESANEALEKSGVPTKPYSPWSHIRPDHTNPEDREDTSMRHPTYEGANQVHSAFETATKNMVNNFGVMGVSRTQEQPLTNNSGLYMGMNMGIGIPTGQGFMNLTHYQPHYSQSGARGGDADAITKFMELQYFKQLAREAGELDDQENSDDEDYML